MQTEIHHGPKVQFCTTIPQYYLVIFKWKDNIENRSITILHLHSLFPNVRDNE